MTNHEEFLKKLRKTFKIEASEGIANMTSNLLKLEKEQSESLKAELIEATFREAHSLKGAARAVNINEIETICQALESVFSGIKKKSISLNLGIFDLFHLTVDILNELLPVTDEPVGDELKEKANELIYQLFEAETGKLNDFKTQTLQIKPEAVYQISEVKEKIEFTINEQNKLIEAIPEAETKAVHTKTENTIRISIEKLDNLLSQVEEMVGLKQNMIHINDKIKNTANKVQIWSHESSEVFSLIQNIVQVNQQNTNDNKASIAEDDLNRVFRYIEWSASMLRSIEEELDNTFITSAVESYQAGVKIEMLLDDVKKIISVPFSTIVDVLPKATRDISKATGKEVVLEVKGADIEIDQRILEELRKPLMHLLRNSIDHGIEKPSDRIRKNKKPYGTIRLILEQLENNRVEIRIADDGSGVDIEKVRQKYVKQEKIPAAEAVELSEKALLDYLFNSGFSTSDMITDLSGRGLGLTIVQEKIEQLGGTVSVKTKKDQGTEFIIEIPLSLVTFRGVNIMIGEREFILPTSRVHQVMQVDRSAIKTIENKASIQYETGFIPFVYLSDILEFPFKENESQKIKILILGSHKNHIAFGVDAIIDEEVVLVKKFNEQLKRVRNVSGVTVLGSGKIVPILNISDLIKSALKGSQIQSREVTKAALTEKKSILVVEDSITSRMLIKNILETSGYRVLTAIDGVEGFSRLKSERFDLVVSDVDMPRMSGLDMTAKIRSDKDISDIPVILVTSLSKREDRERGMEVGANGYIVKGNFDQSNLIEVVEKLIGN
ncbi:MAG: hybrid sensor histidine kinase/response regulator [Bacteroidales bacterium]